MSALAAGLGSELVHVVGEDDTATALGSGDVRVLATPRLLALAEAATVAAVADALPAGATSVGTRVGLEHVRPSPVGTRVTIRASLVAVDGRLLSFAVVAEDPDGGAVGHGRITRVVVDRARFLDRVGAA
ncbi:MAG: thioesterase family protein [Jiangellaceae bacterium]